MFEFLYEIFTRPPSPLYANMAFLGAFIVLFGLVSLFVKERLYLTESLVATIVGIAVGPIGLRLVVPEVWLAGGGRVSMVILEFSRIIIGMQVMAVGVSTPGSFIRKNWQSLVILLGPVMLVMYGVSAVAVKVVLGLSWPVSFIIGACVSPTDPVLASSVIKGKFANRYIPYNLRNLIAIESGANDGLGFPLLMLPIWLMLTGTVSGALSHWAIHTWLYEIAFSILIGLVVGRVARWLLRHSEQRKLIDKESFLVFTIALTLLVTGLVALISSDDLLAVFIAGNAFAWEDHYLEATHESQIVEVIDMLFNISYFIFFGAIIPWARFVEISVWRLVLLAALILLFRRLPIVMALKPWMPTLHSRKEAFFAGWFGPMGVGAIFFSIMSRDLLIGHSPEIADLVFPIVAFLVLSSILIHGITVPITNFHMKKRAKRKIRRINKQEQGTTQDCDQFPSPSEDGNQHESGKAKSGDEEPTERRYEIIDEDDEYEYITDHEDNFAEDSNSTFTNSEVREMPSDAALNSPVSIVVDQQHLRPKQRIRVRKARLQNSPIEDLSQSTIGSIEEDVDIEDQKQNTYL